MFAGVAVLEKIDVTAAVRCTNFLRRHVKEERRPLSQMFPSLAGVLYVVLAGLAFSGGLQVSWDGSWWTLGLLQVSAAQSS